MTYELLYTPELGIFSLFDTCGQPKRFTETELREKLSGDAILIAWLEFSKANPGKRCAYNLLPA